MLSGEGLPIITNDILDLMAREGVRHIAMSMGHDAALAVLEKSTHSTPMEFDTNVWLGDTGASTHMGHCDLGMINVRSI